MSLFLYLSQPIGIYGFKGYTIIVIYYISTSEPNPQVECWECGRSAFDSMSLSQAFSINITPVTFEAGAQVGSYTLVVCIVAHRIRQLCYQVEFVAIAER